MAVLEVRKRTPALILQFEDVVGGIEGARTLDEVDRADAGQHARMVANDGTLPKLESSLRGGSSSR